MSLNINGDIGLGGDSWNVKTRARAAVNPSNINPDRSQGFILAVDGCFLFYDLLAEA
jgi:hypothetical protein